MAKIDTPTDEFADIDLDVYTPETIAGKYERHVLATLAADVRLADAEPALFEQGKRTAVRIMVPTDDVDKEVRFFQDSARIHDRTARKVDQTDQGDGYTRVTFILIPKQTRPRLSPEERAARDAAKAARVAAGETVEPDEDSEDED